MRTRSWALLPSVLLLGACYHAVITTGQTASGQTIEKPWAMSFIYGLVPPPGVETASKCPGGVAKVETQQSFLNGLVSVLTAGIVTPMDIRVSCATRGTSSIDRTISREAYASARAAIEAAGNASVASHAAVLVRF